jgi:hypothetical protein
MSSRSTTTANPRSRWRQAPTDGGSTRANERPSGSGSERSLSWQQADRPGVDRSQPAQELEPRETEKRPGIVCYVKDIAKTVDFYEKRCFEFKLKDSTRATAYINWWWIDFHKVNAADAPRWHVSPNADNAEIGALFYFSVDNVPQAYDELIRKRLQPSNEPIELRGNKEFMVFDPDGYRLVFFKRK